jgi:hypothetical protein
MAHPSATLPTFLRPGDKPACRVPGVDPEWWFPSRGGRHDDPSKMTDLAKARAICRGCELKVQCANWAVDTYQRFGVWGGLSVRQLEARRRCRAGRCPHPQHQRQAVAA